MAEKFYAKSPGNEGYIKNLEVLAHHDCDNHYLFHTTLFMCEDKEQSGAAFEAVKKAPLPKKLRIDRLVIGTSPDGTVGTYQVIKTVCLKEKR